MTSRWFLGVALVVLFCGICGCTRHSTTEHAVPSAPGNAYVLKLTGRVTPSYNPFLNDIVTFTAAGPDKSSFRGELWRGDARDGAFREIFPTEDWPHGNVVRFRNVFSRAERPRDEVVIVNNATKAIRYLRVSALDLFLAFDLQPGVRVVLQQVPPVMYLDVRGDFVDGSQVPSVGRDFEPVRSAHFLVVVENGTSRVDRKVHDR